MRQTIRPEALREILNIFGMDIKDRFITEATVYFRADEAVRVVLTEILLDENRTPADKITIKYKIVEDLDDEC